MCVQRAPTSIFDSRRNLSRKIKCTSDKCKSGHIKFSEFHPGEVERFEQQEDFTIKSVGREKDTTGDVYVMAQCQVCGTQWKVRGLTSVRDLQYSEVNEAEVVDANPQKPSR